MSRISAFFGALVLVAAAGLLPATPAQAAQYSLVQYPAGTASREPAPNVIVSVDDSGSMGTSGINTLKAALRQTFSSENVADGLIRLSWQSMNSSCNTIPLNTTACKNSLKILQGTHRSNFLSWVETLTPSGGTPSHRMVRNAGDYLKRTDLGVNSPWAADPGTREAPVISCRRSYHIFMTDGAWNSGTSNTSQHVDADRDLAAYQAINNIGNLDNTRTTLGDGVTVYDPTAATSRLYKDDWGFNTTVTYERVCQLLIFCQDVARTTYGLNTLSDLAFHYWATDLQPGIANEIRPLIKKSGDETFTSGSGSSLRTTTLPQFWNPRNNPATWQHMTTYTIGFGSGASAWTGSPTFDGDTYAGELNRLITGDIAWPTPLCGTGNTGLGNNACDGSTGYSATAKDNNRRIELWHAALNGRGKFTPAPTADDLTRAFQEIVGTIVEDTSTPVTSFTSASSSVTRTGTSQYSSGYNAAGWTGYVRSDTLAQDSAAATPNPGWGLKTNTGTGLTTADKLDALSASDIANRLILTTATATLTNAAEAPVAFSFANLGTTQKAALKQTVLESDTTTAARVNYLRGDRSLESGGTVRTRNSRQGDIVNSALWYVGAPVSNYSFDNYRVFAAAQAARLPMVYVGGNDGMLHGFSAVNGAERIAYVPKGVIANLKDLASTSYTHRYYVDGSPFSGDVNLGNSSTPNWRTLLVGTLGAGGRGYFVLDITNPGSTATGSTAIASNFAASNAASLVLMDKTAAPGDTAVGDAADIGHVFAAPIVDDNNPQKSSQIVRLNNNRWAVVMGNGYNSANERPVLLLQYLDGARELKTLVAANSGTNATSNGLSAPRLVDIDGNGTPDVVYAGDLRGNLWKFDIGAADAAAWNVAFSGRPFYTAVYTSGNASSAQPITAAPIVRANDRGATGLMVAFGTGRNITEGDRTDVSVQSIYSLLDSTVYRIVSGRVAVDTTNGQPQPIGTGLGSLQQQTVSLTAIAGTDRTFYTVSQNTVAFTGSSARKGWYLNLPEAGERLLGEMSFFDGSNILEVLTEVPGSGSSVLEESCSPASTLPRRFRTFLNIMDGRKPTVQLIDTNGDGVYSITGDSGASRMTASIKESKVSNRSQEIRTGSDGVVDRFAKMPEQPLRPSWRQLR
ncbi:pilus assembly protein [Comamonas antarctica]|uniref:Pilus assembly protein PilC n=1 Tax=Comamonas antarctica TaxID=2743470 RepID=A0A6N1X524_9BURK|nr:PilC/PilY family type IV pilus protein [Comamonas antarctica]QKV53978.1 pilus assembly protein PilC [Comamonas antarctica]